jgi:hypothetical protein
VAVRLPDSFTFLLVDAEDLQALGAAVSVNIPLDSIRTLALKRRNFPNCNRCFWD